MKAAATLTLGISKTGNLTPESFAGKYRYTSGEIAGGPLLGGGALQYSYGTSIDWDTYTIGLSATLGPPSGRVSIGTGNGFSRLTTTSIRTNTRNLLD